jgi:competence protein ComEC
VILGLLVNISSFAESFLLLVLLAVVVIYFFKHTNLKILLGLVMLIGVIVGIVRVNSVIQDTKGWVDVKYSGVGRVVRFAEPKGDYQRVYMEIDGQRIKKGGTAIVRQREIVLMFTPLGINYEYGGDYKVECELKTAENKYDKFNYVRFLAGKKVYQICSGARVRTLSKIDIDRMESVSSNTGLRKLAVLIDGYLENFKVQTFRGIYKFNKILEERINKLFPMPESAYLAGLLLGGDNRLPEDVAENFRRTGTTHTVAVSGYNITILANVFMWLGIGIGLWRKQAFWFVTGCIILFVIMIGAPSSAVRAGIMGVILLYAAQLGRLANSVRVIILTAVVMIFISPFIILYDAGFQLSFLATLGIVLIYGPLSEKFKIENDFLEIKSIVLVTISAQLGVLGILIYTFDSISLISLLANVIILPALPVIMLGGALAIGGSFMLNTLGSVFALPTWAMLHLEVSSIEQLAKFPWAIIEFKGVSVWWSLGYYFILGIIFIVVKVFNGQNQGVKRKR